MTTRFRNAPTPRKALVFAALALAVCIASGSAMAQGFGRCVVADVPSAVVLPDDTVHAAGSLKVCFDKLYSPVAGLHVTYVDGRSVGMFVSRLDESEGLGGLQQPFFVFARNRAGRLVLEAYAWPDNDKFYIYRVRGAGPVSDAQRTAVKQARPELGVGEAEETMFLVAARH